MTKTKAATAATASLNSVWRSKFSGFRDYINGIPDKSIRIQDALEVYREARVLPGKYYQLTVQDIAYKDKQTVELFDSLRNGMQPESLNLPFKTKDREAELIEQLAAYTKGRIDINNAHAKVALQQYRPAKITRNERIFYYWVEAAIAPLTELSSTDDAGKLDFIGCVNGTPSLEGGRSYFENATYSWVNKHGDYMTAFSFSGLLQKCGFSTNINFSQRRKASILLLNLQTPCADWLGSAGKTSIEVTPYEELIAQTVSKLIYKIPSLHGQHVGTVYDTGLGGEYKPFLIEFLKQRKHDIDANPSLRETDRLTQSGVWYRVRPIMIKEGFLPRNKFTDKNGVIRYDWAAARKGFTDSIADVIAQLSETEEEWKGQNVSRESLGIVAKARAMLYINGQVYPVSFDSKEQLARLKVTDMIIVEKEGITDVLLDAAHNYRIALVATAGHFTKYVNDLIKLANELGRINVCVLTDYDIDGILMWMRANEQMNLQIKRIGITKHVVLWLQQNGHPGLSVEDVEEEYNPKLELFKPGIDSYLKENRIELDSIIQEVGAEAFWKYIVYQLETEFPAPRDYREIVPEPEPEDFYSDEINEFWEYIAKIYKQAYTPKWEEIKESKLKQVKGLLQVDDKKNEIGETLRPIVHADESIQKIIARLEELRKSGELPEVKDNEDQE